LKNLQAPNSVAEIFILFMLEMQLPLSETSVPAYSSDSIAQLHSPASHHTEKSFYSHESSGYMLKSRQVARRKPAAAENVLQQYLRQQATHEVCPSARIAVLQNDFIETDGSEPHHQAKLGRLRQS
jgi:hypothetical protein